MTRPADGSPHPGTGHRRLVFLTGFMGSGKSTIGPILANTLGYDFVDVDLLPREELKKVLEDVSKANPQRSFPTIIIGDKVIVGYRELEILEALGL